MLSEGNFSIVLAILIAILVTLLITFTILIVYIMRFSKRSLNRFVSVEDVSSSIKLANSEDQTTHTIVCGDIMHCNCICDLRVIFNNESNATELRKGAGFIWKEDDLIGETFHCEIRKVNLLVKKNGQCIYHSGGVVKKLKNKKSWSNEFKIYQLPKLKHENIILFLDAYKFKNGEFRYSLITHEAKSGSLYSYLMCQPWKDFNECYQVLNGIVSGISFLHDYDYPHIAHRDIKSKNILLKYNLVPCIADFGLAVLLDENFSKEKDFNASHVGTKRYMAPEVLQGNMELSVPGLLATDIYAMALVLWEVLTQSPPPNQLVNNANNEQYCLPYTLELHNEVPTLKNMTELVCVQKQRPEPISWWQDYYETRLIWRCITECWEQRPEERLSTNLVLERLKQINNSQNIMTRSHESQSLNVNV